MPTVLLTYYCALILIASIVGGMIPMWIQLTHRRMEMAVSFVAGVMLGVGVLHMLPHAIAEATAAATQANNAELVSATPSSHGAQFDAAFTVMVCLLAGMMAMFFIERFMCFHHHDAPDDIDAADDDHCDQDHHGHDHASHGHVHDLTWSGAALGMLLHSILDGVALAASVQHDSGAARLAGFGVFLVIALHKPFDSMSIGLLMARGGWSMAWRHTVNALFAMAIPVGVLVFYFGLMPDPAHATSGVQQTVVAYALAFSAGTFLCISLSDLLPELQFHQHDRVKLSAALLLGLVVAYGAGKLESLTHSAHPHAIAPAFEDSSPR